jgi:hypothetical protein
MDDVVSTALHCVPDHDGMPERSENEAVVTSPYFTLYIRQDSPSIRYRSEDYGLNLTCSIWIAVMNSARGWPEAVMRMTNSVMLALPDTDAALIGNGDWALVMRRGGRVYIDRGAAGSPSFPFGELTMEVEEVSLPKE